MDQLGHTYVVKTDFDIWREERRLSFSGPILSTQEKESKGFYACHCVNHKTSE